MPVDALGLGGLLFVNVFGRYDVPSAITSERDLLPMPPRAEWRQQ